MEYDLSKYDNFPSKPAGRLYHNITTFMVGFGIPIAISALSYAGEESLTDGGSLLGRFFVGVLILSCFYFFMKTADRMEHEYNEHCDLYNSYWFTLNSEIQSVTDKIEKCSSCASSVELDKMRTYLKSLKNIHNIQSCRSGEKPIYGFADKAPSRAVAPYISNSVKSNPRAEDPNTYSNAGIYFGIIIVVVFALILFAAGFFSGGSSRPSGSGSSRSAAVYTATPKPRATSTPKPRATATPKPMVPAKTYKPSYADDIVGYYQLNYPATWGYIKKNASYPYAYVMIYDGIWGALQAYHRDGIVFDTLTNYEMSLIYYPNIGSRIYFSDANSRTYHSTLDCYTLLKSSSPVYRSSSTRYQYEPCSKCVGE